MTIVHLRQSKSIDTKQHDIHTHQTNLKEGRNLDRLPNSRRVTFIILERNPVCLPGRRNIALALLRRRRCCCYGSSEEIYRWLNDERYTELIFSKNHKKTPICFKSRVPCQQCRSPQPCAFLGQKDSCA